MEIKLAKLETAVEAGFTEIRIGMANAEDRQQERHSENRERLDSINGRVNDAHTKADGLSGLMKSMSERVEKVAESGHRLRSWVQEQYGRVMPPVKELGEDGQKVSRAELKWVIGLIVACITIGAGVTMWIMKIAGKL